MITFNLTLEDMPSRDKKLSNIAIVENFKSSKSGLPIANQFRIALQNGIIVFQSYNSIIQLKLIMKHFLIKIGGTIQELLQDIETYS